MFLYLLGGALVLFGLYCMFSSSDVSGPVMQAGGLGIVGLGFLFAAFGKGDDILGGVFLALVTIGIDTT